MLPLSLQPQYLDLGKVVANVGNRNNDVQKYDQCIPTWVFDLKSNIHLMPLKSLLLCLRFLKCGIYQNQRGS